MKLNLTKNHHTQSLLKNWLLIVFILFQSSEVFFVQSHAFKYDTLKSFSYECFFSNQLDSCKIALEKTEELQYIAGLKENFSCQTRLLGFQSKLIMVILNMPKGRSSLGNLEDVKRACSLFFED